MPLVTLKTLCADTIKKRYGVGMFNIAGLEFGEAIVEAAEELRAPVMLGLPERFFNYYGMETAAHLCLDLANRASVPVAVHLDHGKSIDLIYQALRLGFSSIMFDGSALPYEENVAKTAEIVRIAHSMGVSVEGELGYIGRGDKEAVEYDKSLFTKPDQAVDFVERTGVDALAIAIGTIHGVYRGTPELDFDRLREIRERLDCGLVLHGGSGLSNHDFKQAVTIGIDKVNIYTELSQLALANTQQILPSAKEWPEVSRSLRTGIKELVKERIAVFGSANRVE